MKKKFIALFIALTLLCVSLELVACGKNTGEEADENYVYQNVTVTADDWQKMLSAECNNYTIKTNIYNSGTALYATLKIDGNKVKRLTPENDHFTAAFFEYNETETVFYPYSDTATKNKIYAPSFSQTDINDKEKLEAYQKELVEYANALDLSECNFLRARQSPDTLGTKATYLSNVYLSILQMITGDKTFLMAYDRLSHSDEKGCYFCTSEYGDIKFDFEFYVSYSKKTSYYISHIFITVTDSENRANIKKEEFYIKVSDIGSTSVTLPTHYTDSDLSATAPEGTAEEE